MLLRQQLVPTMQGSQAVAPQQPRLAINPALRAAVARRPAAQQVQVSPYQPQEVSGGQPVDPNDQGPTTEDIVNHQIQQLQQVSAPPTLQPGARVRSPSANLVQPDQFQQFYENFDLITQRGHARTASEQTRASARHLAELQKIFAQRIPQFQGVQYQGNGNSNSIGGSVANLPSNPRANFKFAQNIAPAFGWGPRELAAWYELGMKESGWDNNAQNPTSTAYGIGQFLNTTWGNYGFKKSSDPAYQVRAMAEYIRKRYGSPANALAFHRRNNWY